MGFAVITRESDSVTVSSYAPKGSFSVAVCALSPDVPSAVLALVFPVFDVSPEGFTVPSELPHAVSENAMTRASIAAKLFTCFLDVIFISFFLLFFIDGVITDNFIIGKGIKKANERFSVFIELFLD